jgi:Tfp pilus assembly protein FimT
VELMVVLGILAVLATFSIPALSVYLPGYRAKTAARSLISELQMARLRAIAKNKRHTLTVDTTAQTITLTEENNAVPVTVMTFGNTAPASPKGPHFKNVLIGRTSGFDAPLTSLSHNASAPVTFTVPGSMTVETELDFLPNGASTRGGEIYLIPSSTKTGVREANNYAVQVNRPGLVRVYRHFETPDPVTGDFWREWI